jgi:F-box protein 9
MSTSTPAAAPAKAKIKVEEENPELARFREEWLAELRRQGKALVNTSAAAQPKSPLGAAGSGEPLLASNSQHPVTQALSAPSPGPLALSADAPKQTIPTRTLPASHPAVTNGGIATKQFHVFERALEVYRQAIEHEQRGELDEALRLYRQAFRLVCLATCYTL